jgi:hypothetical protein
LALNALVPVPATLDENVEIILFTCVLPHDGQSTSSTAFADLTNSSKGSLQSVHINSKIGIHYSLISFLKARLCPENSYLFLDVKIQERLHKLMIVSKKMIVVIWITRRISFLTNTDVKYNP